MNTSEYLDIGNNEEKNGKKEESKKDININKDFLEKKVEIMNTQQLKGINEVEKQKKNKKKNNGILLVKKRFNNYNKNFQKNNFANKILSINSFAINSRTIII